MTWVDIAYRSLKEQGIESVVFVPDTVLGELIQRTEADPAFDVISPTREEEGVGLICGAFLGGKRGVLMLQNSGLGNAANALASLAVPYDFPFLMLISQRGELGEFNVVQVGMGQALRPILDGLGIPHFTLEREDEVAPVLAGAARLAYSTDRPVAIILSPLLTGGKAG